MPLTTSGLDKPGGTEYRRASRSGVDEAAPGTLRGLDCVPLQMTQEAYVSRLLPDGGHEPERTSSAPGTDPEPSALSVFLFTLREGGLP
jgi:hypothetical protein